MSFSENYLNKILYYATNFHNEEKQPETIPNNLDNLNVALNKFKNALEFEAHQSMTKQTAITDNPILYTVNLNSKKPGIIVDYKNKSVNVYSYDGNNDYNYDSINIHRKQKSKVM